MANQDLDINAFIDEDAIAAATEALDFNFEEFFGGNEHGIEGLNQEQGNSEKLLDGFNVIMRNHELNKGSKMKAPMPTTMKIIENQNPRKTITREIEEMVKEMRMRRSMKDESSSYDQAEELANRIRRSSGIGFGTGEESGVTGAIDNGAFVIGNELSRFLSDFLNLFSECSEVVELIQELRSSLVVKSVTEDVNPATISRIFTLLELADEEVGKARDMNFISYEKEKDGDRIEKLLEDLHQGSPAESMALRREELSDGCDMIQGLQKCKQMLDVLQKKIHEMKLNYGRVFGYIQVYEILKKLKNSEIKGM